jgi:hypothetical protein
LKIWTANYGEKNAKPNNSPEYKWPAKRIAVSVVSIDFSNLESAAKICEVLENDTMPLTR